MVKRVEFYDDRRDANSAVSCHADEQRGQSVNLADVELEHGSGCGDV